jgi:hypothetical protein
MIEKQSDQRGADSLRNRLTSESLPIPWLFVAHARDVVVPDNIHERPFTVGLSNTPDECETGYSTPDHHCTGPGRPLGWRREISSR